MRPRDVINANASKTLQLLRKNVLMLPDALRAIASQHQCRFQIVEQMSKRIRFREHWNEAGHRGTPQTGVERGEVHRALHGRENRESERIR